MLFLFLFVFCFPNVHTHILDELAEFKKNQSSIAIGGSEDGARDIRPISVQFHSLLCILGENLGPLGSRSPHWEILDPSLTTDSYWL